MTDLDRLLEGKSINLLVYDEPSKGRYYSAIYRITNDFLMIIAPNDKGTPLLLPVGTKVAISFWDDIRAYMFETIILGRSNSFIPTFNVKKPKKLLEIQRRNYVRVLTINPISFQVIYADKEPTPWFNAFSLDLSGGGIRFTTSEKITKEDAVNIRLDLAGESIEALCRVCRADKDNLTGNYLVAVEFASISKQDRERLISFIFDIQRDLLKRGLLT